MGVMLMPWERKKQTGNDRKRERTKVKRERTQDRKEVCDRVGNRQKKFKRNSQREREIERTKGKRVNIKVKYKENITACEIHQKNFKIKMPLGVFQE